MRSAYGADEVRKAEAPMLASLPDGTLMQRAATALARRCASLLDRVYGARVVVLAGGGNNGGDALLAGAALARRGARVDIVRVSDPALDASSTTSLLRDADLVIDGMLGIGGSGGLRSPAADVAKILENTESLVVAVDIPYCYACASRVGARSPYETVAGMTAIARGLPAQELRRRLAAPGAKS